MPGSRIDHHRRFCQQHAAFVERVNPAQSAAHWLHCDIAAHAGYGWMDVCDISHGLTIGRGNYAFNAPWQCDYSEPMVSGLGVYILLSGQMRFTLEGETAAHAISGGTVHLYNRAHTPERMYFQQAAVTPFQGVTITLPASLLDELTADAPALASLAQRPGYLPLARGQASMQMMQIARQMLDIPADTSIGRLRLESQALELAAVMAGHLHCCMRFPKSRLPQRQQIAVEDTLDILEREWASPHTITALSRRVRLNECYLKTAFRRVTGQTIAYYLRHLRMRHARRLIEDTRTSVLQAAAFVGYSNPSHFARAFKAVHGFAPSRLKS